jgi:hypothetical protein
MSVTLKGLFSSVPEYWSWKKPEEHLRKCAQAINGILNGQTNNSYDLVLEAGESSTTITDERITAKTMAVLSPQNAAAAADLASMWYVASGGQIVIHHPISASADRNLGVAIIG